MYIDKYSFKYINGYEFKFIFSNLLKINNLFYHLLFTSFMQLSSPGPYKQTFAHLKFPHYIQ